MVCRERVRARRHGDGSTRALLVVDPAVGNASVLLDGRQAGAEVLHLAAGGRGLEQIADHLSGRHGIASLHILSHGEPGALRLAGELIELPGLVMRPAVLADIAAALTADAQVVLYGCSLAAGPSGRRFLDYLEASLGVAVAASVTPVGAAVLGGGWTLRGRYGEPVASAFAPAARAAYPDLLADVVDAGGRACAPDQRAIRPSCRRDVLNFTGADL